MTSHCCCKLPVNSECYRRLNNANYSRSRDTSFICKTARVSHSAVNVTAVRTHATRWLHNGTNACNSSPCRVVRTLFLRDGQTSCTAVCQCRTVGGGGFNPPKFRRPSKIVPNSTRMWKLLKTAEFRTPTPQYVWKKGSKILKLPRFAIVLYWQWQINWLSS